MCANYIVDYSDVRHLEITLIGYNFTNPINQYADGIYTDVCTSPPVHAMPERIVSGFGQKVLRISGAILARPNRSLVRLWEVALEDFLQSPSGRWFRLLRRVAE